MGQSKSQHKKSVSSEEHEKKKPRILGQYRKKKNGKNRDHISARIFTQLLLLFTCCGRKGLKKRNTTSDADIHKDTRKKYVKKDGLTTASVDPDTMVQASSRKMEPADVHFKITAPGKSQTLLTNKTAVSCANDCDKLIEEVEAMFAKTNKTAVSCANDWDKLIEEVEAMFAKITALRKSQALLTNKTAVSCANDWDKLIEEAEAMFAKTNKTAVSCANDCDKLIEEVEAMLAMELASSRQMEPADVNLLITAPGKSQAPLTNKTAVSCVNDCDKLIEEVEAMLAMEDLNSSSQMEPADVNF
ncbi:uncharacterized protein LOC143485182 isoform X1 [Brachyhypopomus gauderio]|uniref:uncharacterized protein LOC143485182 isoform X1 n=1 Tax=Brachyhypopomus gauderio TaxID=698409 RepID=UPI00404218D3